MIWPIRPATRDDAVELAWLINIAGEGLPEYLWSAQAREGETPLQAGARRAARDRATFSYRNALVVQDDGRVPGMLIHDRLPGSPAGAGDAGDVPEVLRPLSELEALAGGGWYVNAVAVHAAYRGRGIATSLLAASEAAARQAGCDRISLIVAGENRPARDLYFKLGYRDRAERPIVSYRGCLRRGEWVLMAKQL